MIVNQDIAKRFQDRQIWYIFGGPNDLGIIITLDENFTKKKKEERKSWQMIFAYY